MSEKTNISWTATNGQPGATLNCIAGCDRVSPGCAACYAVANAWRMASNPNPAISSVYADVVERQPNGRLDWTGLVRCLPERLGLPHTWAKPRRIFVNSLADTFHPAVPIEFLAELWAMMAMTPRHTYQILTKRPERMAAVLRDPNVAPTVASVIAETPGGIDLIGYDGLDWPLPNVWLGTSVERQQEADQRIPHLLRCPAAVRFLSAEPLLGPIDLARACWGEGHPRAALDIQAAQLSGHPLAGLHWVIAGGQSGGNRTSWLVSTCHTEAPDGTPCQLCGGTGWKPDPNALAWARSLRDQCQAAGVPFFFKQWGGPQSNSGGRLLDGQVWDQQPAPAGGRPGQHVPVAAGARP